VLKSVLFGSKFGKAVHYPIIKKKFKLIGIVDQRKKMSNNEINNLINKANIITIATPPKFQKKIFTKSYNTNKHVFFEKPLGFLPSKKIRLNKNQALMTSYIFPEIDVWKKLKYLITKDYFGKISHVQIDWLFKSYINKFKIKSWKSSTKQNGGILNNFGPHVFHYVEFFFGKIKSIEAYTSDNNKSNINIDIELKNKISVDISLNSLYENEPTHSIKIYGDKYNSILSNSKNNITNNFKLLIFNNSKIINSFKSKLKKNTQDERIKPMESLYKKFILWIKYKKIQKPNFNDAYRTEFLIHKTIKSLKLKKKININ
jgi:predicted dehydrogenase